jgi:NADPH:quinone reductase-like Zn-dependent oxidoreductase
VGPGVTAYAVGDEVFSSPDHKRNGTSAELVVIPANPLARKPANLAHAEAASLSLVALTAWDCLVRAADLKSGEKVLFHAGSAGSAPLPSSWPGTWAPRSRPPAAGATSRG